MGDCPRVMQTKPKPASFGFKLAAETQIHSPNASIAIDFSLFHETLTNSKIPQFFQRSGLEDTFN